MKCSLCDNEAVAKSEITRFGNLLHVVPIHDHSTRSEVFCSKHIKRFVMVASLDNRVCHCVSNNRKLWDV